MRSAPRRYSSLCSLTGKSAWTVGHRQEHARAFARHWRLAGTNEFVHMNRDEFYSTHVSVKCKSCLDKLCTVKRDLYNAVVMKCRFVSLCKFPVKALPAKACAVTRKIMKRNVEWVIREMKESEFASLDSTESNRALQILRASGILRILSLSCWTD
ncbi:PREDICTED: uncharacterized protein LOC105556033 isoform X2 [Vollenhovia emeryi]|uniref:uncharacterized protein LOC105556033 isoform X2 n=1 Tax=Vollenhovia emeryi TaxID=411798 RepID=UPI0005F44E1C|nr:PREDICTED: uncharacterized protein LOC105556033 isoform X2 [Vollenhovia emeryi]